MRKKNEWLFFPLSVYVSFSLSLSRALLRYTELSSNQLSSRRETISPCFFSPDFCFLQRCSTESEFRNTLRYLSLSLRHSCIRVSFSRAINADLYLKSLSLSLTNVLRASLSSRESFRNTSAFLLGYSPSPSHALPISASLCQTLLYSTHFQRFS